MPVRTARGRRDPAHASASPRVLHSGREEPRRTDTNEAAARTRDRVWTVEEILHRRDSARHRRHASGDLDVRDVERFQREAIQIVVEPLSDEPRRYIQIDVRRILVRGAERVLVA